MAFSFDVSQTTKHVKPWEKQTQAYAEPSLKHSVKSKDSTGLPWLGITYNSQRDAKYGNPTGSS